MATVASDPAALTARQREIFTFIYEFTREYGFQPSIREMESYFGFVSHNGPTCHLRALAHKGWIELRADSARSIIFRYRPDGEPFTGFADKEYS